MVKYYQEQKKTLRNLIRNEIKEENIIDFEYVWEKIVKNISLSENCIQGLLSEMEK